MIQEMMKFFKKWWNRTHPKSTQTENVQSQETLVEDTTQLPVKTKVNPLSSRLETFLTKHYSFRYNVLTEQAEVCTPGEKKFRPVTSAPAA